MIYYQGNPELYKKFKPRNLLIVGKVITEDTHFFSDFKFDYINDIYEKKSVSEKNKMDDIKLSYNSMLMSLKKEMRIDKTIHDLKVTIDSIQNMGNDGEILTLKLKTDKLNFIMNLYIIF